MIDKTKCYFCRQEVQIIPDHSPGPFHPKISRNCENCSKPNNLYEVCTVIDDDGNVEFAHIYPDKQEYIRVGGSLNIPGSSITVPTNKTFHIRLEIKNNQTYIGLNTIIEEIMMLPGLPIKPSNAREKLKLYLLFS